MNNIKIEFNDSCCKLISRNVFQVDGVQLLVKSKCAEKRDIVKIREINSLVFTTFFRKNVAFTKVLPKKRDSKIISRKIPITKYSDMLNMKALVGIRIILMGKGLQ